MGQDVERNIGGLLVRELGKTGLKVSNLGFGGGHFIGKDLEVQESIRLLHQAIEEGMTTLYQDGLDKVVKGITSLEEVFRIAKKTQQDEESEEFKGTEN